MSHLDTIHSLSAVLQSWKGGNNFYGCILGGLTGSVIYWWRRPFPFWKMTDVAAPAVAIGIAIGRIGCFLNGCCYGCVSDQPWAICFPADSHAWARQVDAGLISPLAAHSLPVHPTQIYASLAGFALLLLLLTAFRWRRVPGEVMCLLMVVYPLTRWPLEAIRGDEPAIFAGMTLSQNVSIGVFLSGLAVWTALRWRALVSVVLGFRPLPAQARWLDRRRLRDRDWVWHWHPDGPVAGANKGRTAFDRKDCEAAGRSRST